MAKKKHLEGPPPLSTYGYDLWCTRSGKTIPQFHKKKSPDLSPQGLPGLAWREEKKCKSTPYNGQYSNICKSTLYRGQYLLQHHHNRDPSPRRHISVKDTVVHS